MKKYVLVGSLGGFLNGLLGGGGGALLVPLLSRWQKQRVAMACSVVIILPICGFSAILYGLEGNLDWKLALPYLIGGGIGGFFGGKFFPKVSSLWLKRGFGILMMASGVRCFFG